MKTYCFHRSFVAMLSMAAFFMPVSAQTSFQEKALQLACEFLPLQQLQLSYESPSFYVFSSGEKGFAVVSKQEDNCHLVGYSKDGHFDVSTMPQSMREWLEGYTTPTRVPKLHNAIAPMLKTQWGQWKPYNLLVSNENPTGCVTTAMAQLMAYHRWPVGSVSATGILPETIFDWDAMMPTYSDTDTGYSADEVAKLMKYCMTSVGAKFTDTGTSASMLELGEALKRDYGYSDDIKIMHRLAYSSEEWDSIVYSELAEGRPVAYRARKDNGHAFIIDGYDGQGLFHVNWGWDGE